MSTQLGPYRAIMGGAFAVALSVGSGLALPTAAAQEIRLQGAVIFPPDNLWSLAGQRFAERVEERTDGRVVIEWAYGGALGNARETIEALSFGTADIVTQQIDQLNRYDPIAGLGAYPYMIRDIDHFRAVMYESDLGQDFFDEVEERTGYKLVGAGYRGPRETASRTAFQTPDDLRGLKIRVPEIEIYARTWEMLGASPVPMPSLEVYTALQQGIVDAVENPLEAHVRSRYYEAVPYVVLTGHVNPYYSFIFWGDRFNSLPEDVQQVLIEEGEEAMRWGTEQTLELIAEYEARLKEEGAEFVEPDREALQAALEPLLDEYAEYADWIQRFQQAGS
jgi:TRAP-type transport system periplasmic protein